MQRGGSLVAEASGGVDYGLKRAEEVYSSIKVTLQGNGEE